MDFEDIGEIIRRHDHFQFEVKLDYQLDKDAAENRYRVETFFFLPNNLDVNESTYSKKQFYRDLLLYIRFKAPDVSLADLAEDKLSGGALARLTRVARALRENADPRAVDAIDEEIRLFGCTFKGAIQDRVRELERILQGRAAPGDSNKGPRETEAVETFARDVRKVRQGYAAAHAALKDPAVPARPLSTYAFTDEYISLLIENHAHHLLQLLADPKRTNAPAEDSALLAELIREEIRHREEMRFPSLVSPSSDNETFLFRFSVLKKFVSSVLHLSVRTEEEGQGLRELALALAAGIAMLFAASVMLYYQKNYGLSLTLVTALVVSYMLKDRIKEWLRAYFHQVLSRRLFDLQNQILDPASGLKVGVCREGMQFTEESEIDPRVTALRNKDHITEIENDWRSERILHYVKEISLRAGRLAETHARFQAVTDIARFNVRNFLMKMDEPESEVFHLEGDKSVRLKGTRIYHVNMVIKYVSGGAVRYDRIRLVLSRNGIKRIEPVSSETTDAPSERASGE